MSLTEFTGLTFFKPLTSSATTWNRPSDWPAMPTSNPNQIVILAAVFNNGSNYCALQVTVSSGTYTVDWGDGTAPQTYTSATQANYQYSYSSSGLSGVLSEGYKTAIIKITPTSGGTNITAINLGKRNSSISVAASQPWLDLQINASSCTSFVVHSTQNSEYLQRCNIFNIGSVTSLTTCFYGCSALQSVSFPSGSLGSVTNLNSCFYGCSALQSVSFPSGSLGSVTSLNSCFYYCFALQSVSFPSGSLGSVTDLSNCFYDCYALQSVSFPSGSLGSVTSLSNCFYDCSALQSVSFPSGSLGSVTSLTSCFYGCYALQSVSFPSGSLGSVTDLSYCFNACSALQSVSFPSGSLGSVTNLNSCFYGCSALQSVSFPSGSLGSVTSLTSCFSSCASLAKIDNCAIPVSFSIASCNLSATNINAIFTSLPSVSSQTITTDSNVGTSGATNSIATGKGWTVA